jgi:NADH-ubiquinone oxidoreductase chain 6
MNNLYITSENFTNGYRVEVLDFFSIFSIISGIFVIVAKNPVVSVLFLISLFLNISSYLIILGINFIGLSYLLVYVGAVSILFLFILMLINIRISELLSNTSNSIPLAIIISIAFNYPVYQILPYSILTVNELVTYLNVKLNNNLHYLYNEVYNNIFSLFKNSINNNEILFVTGKVWDSNLAETGHISSIGNIMYTSYSIWLILTSIILLLAMVGAIVITIKQKNSYPPKPYSFINSSLHSGLDLKSIVLAMNNFIKILFSKKVLYRALFIFIVGYTIRLIWKFYINPDSSFFHRPNDTESLVYFMFMAILSAFAFTIKLFENLPTPYDLYNKFIHGINCFESKYMHILYGNIEDLPIISKMNPANYQNTGESSNSSSAQNRPIKVESPEPLEGIRDENGNSAPDIFTENIIRELSQLDSIRSRDRNNCIRYEEYTRFLLGVTNGAFKWHEYKVYLYGTAPIQLGGEHAGSLFSHVGEYETIVSDLCKYFMNTNLEFEKKQLYFNALNRNFPMHPNVRERYIREMVEHFQSEWDTCSKSYKTINKDIEAKIQMYSNNYGLDRSQILNAIYSHNAYITLKKENSFNPSKKD